VLVNVPAASPAWKRVSQTTDYRDLVPDKLAGHGFDVCRQLDFEAILTQLDLEQRTEAYRGCTVQRPAWPPYGAPIIVHGKSTGNISVAGQPIQAALFSWSRSPEKQLQTCFWKINCKEKVCLKNVYLWSPALPE
jgi:hypothetical protein